MVLKRKYIVNAIFLLFIIGSLIYIEKSTDKFEEELLQNGKFAIGTFEKFGYAYKAGVQTINTFITMKIWDG